MKEAKDMKEGWEYKKLGEVCEITMGQSPDSKSYNKDGNGLPFFQGCADFGTLNPNISTYCSEPKKIAEPLDVLMSVRAPVGTLNIANTKCCIGRGLASFREIKNKSSYKFLYYLLKSSERYFQDNSTGATFKAIGKDLIVNYKIKIPSLNKQIEISSELDLLSGVIEKQKAQLEELDKLAQSIFYDMFGDPVNNEKGWEMKKLYEISNVGTGSTPSRNNGKYYEGGAIPWVKTTEVQNCEIFETEEKISELAIKETNCKVYPIGTLLLAMYGQGKTRGQLAKLRIEAATNQACAAIVLNNDFSIPDYVYEYLHLQYENIRDMARGGNQLNLNLNIVKAIPIFLPPLSLQQEFAAKVEAIEALKAKVRLSLKEAETLFNERMDYYFN